MQVVVDCNKRFFDVAVAMLQSTHAFRMLRFSSLYQQAKSGAFFDPAIFVDGFYPFLLGNSRYPFKHWLMTPYHDGLG